MTQARSSNTNIRRRRLPRKEVFGAEITARVNKNFVVQDEGFSSVVCGGATGRDLQVLLLMLSEAQTTKSRRVKFASAYVVLQKLGWSHSGRDYRNLREAFDFWRDTGFRFDKWYKSSDMVRKSRGYVSDPRARQKMKRDYDRKQRTERSFRRVWKIVRDRKGRGLTVVFDSSFHKANARLRYYCKLDLATARALHQPERILLALLIDAMPTIKNWSPETVARKIGMQDANPRRLMPRIEKAVEHVGELTGKDIVCSQDKNGRLRIDADPMNRSRRKMEREFRKAVPGGRPKDSRGKPTQDFIGYVEYKDEHDLAQMLRSLRNENDWDDLDDDVPDTDLFDDEEVLA